MRLSDYRIKTRIYIGFGALIAIAAGVAAVGVTQLGTIDRQIVKFVSVAGNTSRNLEVQHIAERMRRVALKYQTTQDASFAKQFDADEARTLELLDAAAKATISEERRRLYGDASKTIASAREGFNKLIDLGSKIASARAKLFTGGDELTAATQKLVDAARAQSDDGVKMQAMQLESAVLLVRVANWRFLATHDPKGPATFKANTEKAEAALTAFAKNAAAAGLQELIAPVKTSLRARRPWRSPATRNKPPRAPSRSPAILARSARRRARPAPPPRRSWRRPSSLDGNRRRCAGRSISSWSASARRDGASF